MDILIVGNGGREHALTWKIAQSPRVKHLFVAPGNAGTALEPKTKNIAIEPTEITALVEFAITHAIDLVIVGPEAPLALGLCDQLQQTGIACFGPSQAAAQLESSKRFCKAFLQKNAIPTARFAAFDRVEPALHYLKTQSFPIVIKADGLAAGKGVVIAENFDTARETVVSMLEGHAFGQASRWIVIEEFLRGEELSFICIVDGNRVIPLASSQDHKRRDDGDRGPNTGGMGAYSPAPLLTAKLEALIMQRIMTPTVKALQAMKTPYLGFLYAGLMITPEGEPKVLEFNCRLGDPETQPILFRLKTDLVNLCLAAIHHTLNPSDVVWDPRPALAVVLASDGYPDVYEKGHIIRGLPERASADCKVFHAGTRDLRGNVLTDGGRVLSVTAIGLTLQAAHDCAYATAAQITWPGRFFRSDIGQRALQRPSTSQNL